MAPYPGGYVAAAYAVGIVEGKSASVFDPFGPLTRAQAMTIAVRTAEKLKARDLKPLPDGYRGQCSPGSTTPTTGKALDWPKLTLLLEGIDLRGWEDPWATATRSEAATIVWNLVGCFG